MCETRKNVQMCDTKAFIGFSGRFYTYPGFFFVRLDQNSGPIKTQVLTKTQTIFSAKLMFLKLLQVAQ